MRGIKQAAAVLIPGLVAICIAAPARADDTYKIKLDHPFKVGDTFGVSAKLKMKVTQTVNGGAPIVPPESDYTCVLEGTETIVEVADNSKEPTKYTFKVGKCTKDGTAIVPEGATVTAENKDGETVVTIDGKEPDKDLVPVLRDIFETTDPKDPSADEQMGTTEAQKVGGTWDFKTDTLAKKLQEQKLPFAPDDLKGKGVLNDVSKVDGKDVEKVTVTVDGTFDKKDAPGIPGATYSNGKLKVEVVGVLPVDQDARPLSTKSTVSMSFTINAPDATVVVSVERSKDLTVTEAKQ